MSLIAPTLQAWFTERLITQRHASPGTIRSYRDTMRLLLEFAHQRLRTPASELDLQLDAALIAAFLEHLEEKRENSIGTRNARLAAIRSLYKFASLRHPEHAELIARVLAIPPKRYDRALITHLSDREIEALLRARPERPAGASRSGDVRAGDRDRPARLGADRPQTRRRPPRHPGARGLRGKGRKERITPLTKPTTAVLRGWLTERGGTLSDPVFPTSRGAPLTRDAVARRLAKHATNATLSCPTLRAKNVTPHVLRHTAAMRLLHAGIDATVIALWLGHESVETTQIYHQADVAIKERALARTKPTTIKAGRYKPPDALLAFLEAL